MAEDLTEYYRDLGVRVEYLHSEVKTLDRVRILRDLRRGEFDVLVGVNLLREGLDLPEVSLVAILDADKEGYLRSASSLKRRKDSSSSTSASSIPSSQRRAWKAWRPLCLPSTMRLRATPTVLGVMIS